MNSTNFSRISNVSPSSSIPCFIHVAPTPTHAKLKTDIYYFPTLGHRPGSENKEFGFSCNDYRNVWCQRLGQFEDRFRFTAEEISLGTMASLGRKWIFIDAPRRTTRGFRKDLPLKNATRMSSATMLYFPLRIVCSPSASSTTKRQSKPRSSIDKRQSKPRSSGNPLPP